MVNLLIIKLNPKEIDGVPVTGIPVGSRTVDRHSSCFMIDDVS